MGFQDVAFLPPEIVFPPHFLKIVVEVGASGAPHVLGVWLGISKDMLPVKYFCSTKSLLCQSNFMEIIWLMQS